MFLLAVNIVMRKKILEKIRRIQDFFKKDSIEKNCGHVCDPNKFELRTVES